MKKYLILLKPIEEFFFGSERNFKDIYSKNYTNEDNITYVLKSRYYPQQTSILGMLRKEILVQSDFELKQINKYEKADWKKMKELIGEQSFNIKSSKIQDFGKIKKLSPLFLYDTKNKHFYSKAPKDHQIYYKKGIKNSHYSPFKLDKKKIRVNVNKENYIRLFDEKYKLKIELSDDFINLSCSNKEIIKSDNIFKPVEHIGIDIKREKDAYYKQTHYRLQENFVFAFFLESNFKFNNNIVHLGKRSSAFKMKVEENTFNLNNIINTFKKKNKIILLSDGYLPNDIENDIEFSIRESISFRNLVIRDGENAMKLLETKYNFWEKGSIIYVSCDKKNEVSAKITANQNMVKIGYNYIV